MMIGTKRIGTSVRRARLEAYFAVGVGAIGLGTSCEAAVVSIDLTGKTGDNMGIAPGGFQNFYDVLPNSQRLIGFNGSLLGSRGISVQNGGGIAATAGNALGQPVKFASGATIGSSSTFFGAYMATIFKSNYRTVADFGPNSFLGFKTAAGQYGYFEVLWTASTNTFKLVSAAYESTPGVAIQTPSGGGAVPEPASGAIAALLVGGTALRQWRKKRRDASNEAAAS
jgi:hypothetical protein